MSSSYDYPTPDTQYSEIPKKEEYNYYATEKLLRSAYIESGDTKKTIEMLILSNTID